MCRRREWLAVSSLLLAVVRCRPLLTARELSTQHLSAAPPPRPADPRGAGRGREPRGGPLSRLIQDGFALKTFRLYISAEQSAEQSAEHVEPNPEIWLNCTSFNSAHLQFRVRCNP